MKSLWSNADANAMVSRYAERGVSEDLALRVYTSRLLGNEPRLVQHGGGNTSVKTRSRDVLGQDIDVLCVKGSGWDLGAIEPAGLPAVRLEPLLALRRLDTLSDEAMVNAQRAALLDSTAPTPSVETLLHAWIAHKFVDHTHANAILALTDQPDGEALCRDLYGKRLAVAPYCMAGFSLAQLAARVFETDPSAEGMILLKHGIFSWGVNARQSYERMIEFVDMAEERLRRGAKKSLKPLSLPQLARAARVAPLIRGALAESLGEGRWRRWILEHRTGPEILGFVGGADVERYSQRGVVTPDHVIRIKPWPLILPAPRAADLDTFAGKVRGAVDAYADRYRGYFERNNVRVEAKKKALDPWPRVVLVPGLGLFGVGGSQEQAKVAADIAETNIAVITAAEAMDRFESHTEAEIFEMEYWSLEQAKLGKEQAKPLAGQIVVVTGGGGTIGTAIARAFAAAGAAVAVLDRDRDAATRTADSVRGLALGCDLTSSEAVTAAFDEIVCTYGGMDILVSNAGAAWQGRIGEVDEGVLRQSFELNFFAHQRVAQAAVRVMRAQGTGGCLLFNVSKQAINPGPDFGPYGLPKAATLFLSRQYAVDYGADGIRSNAVNADRIRSGLLNDEMVKARSAARNLSEHEYMAGNLLGQEVTADDVAKAFLALALAERTTAAVLTVDGGNIAAALR
jgi:rhamnose utilization protein RhaD (predicted bifunctional aldolase and dehydrogenase)/NAD(P)-dependent dehydrogenase (short-subunit alcohol dehydrogenase family)